VLFSGDRRPLLSTSGAVNDLACVGSLPLVARDGPLQPVNLQAEISQFIQRGRSLSEQLIVQPFHFGGGGLGVGEGVGEGIVDVHVENLSPTPRLPSSPWGFIVGVEIERCRRRLAEG
jgi:hypothetical protein